MEPFSKGLQVLASGFSGWSILRTLLWDLRATGKFMRELIARKGAEPGDDILSELLRAEEEGDRLSHDEVLSMVFLLIIAGFETTQHLIGNGMRTLLEHPDQLARLRAEPELWDSAVEEIVRHRGPVHGTKPLYPTEDVEFHGVTFRRGTATIPLIAAANHDPRVFDEPDRFDVARTPNRHLGFGFGAHFCLGAQLARMETRIRPLWKDFLGGPPRIEPGTDGSKVTGTAEYQRAFDLYGTRRRATNSAWASPACSVSLDHSVARRGSAAASWEPRRRTDGAHVVRSVAPLASHSMRRLCSLA